MIKKIGHWGMAIFPIIGFFFYNGEASCDKEFTLSLGNNSLGIPCASENNSVPPSSVEDKN